MFNPYPHIRWAGVASILVSYFLNDISFNIIGLILIASGTVGAVDRLEREIKLLMEKEKSNEETGSDKNLN